MRMKCLKSCEVKDQEEFHHAKSWAWIQQWRWVHSSFSYLYHWMFARDLSSNWKPSTFSQYFNVRDRRGCHFVAIFRYSKFLLRNDCHFVSKPLVRWMRTHFMTWQCSRVKRELGPSLIWSWFSCLWWAISMWRFVARFVGTCQTFKH